MCFFSNRLQKITKSLLGEVRLPDNEDARKVFMKFKEEGKVTIKSHDGKGGARV